MSAALPRSSPPPMPAVARILSRFDRPHLEGFIAVALELIDALDGDSDLEDDPREEDDPQGAYDEDEISTGPGLAALYAQTGPGCLISDEGVSALTLGLDQSRPISDDNPAML